MLNSILSCSNPSDCIRLTVKVLIILLIQMFLLKYFWNKALVPHISVLRPIQTLIDALMVSVGFSVVTALV